MKATIVFFSVFLTLVFFSCKNLHNSSLSDSNNKKIQSAIVLMQLHISKEIEGYIVTITDVLILESSKSIGNKESVPLQENDFIGILLDEKKNSIDTLHIAQPLHPRFEYPLEDNSIGSKVIEHKENNVLLRFAYSAAMKYLRIEKVGEHRILQYITTLEIPSLDK